MRLKTRIERLEVRIPEFRVVCPIYLDAQGVPEGCAEKLSEERVASIRFGEETSVDRLENEPFRDFEVRAHNLARKQLGSALILMRGANCL